MASYIFYGDDSPRVWDQRSVFSYKHVLTYGILVLPLVPVELVSLLYGYKGSMDGWRDEMTNKSREEAVEEDFLTLVYLEERGIASHVFCT